MLDARDGVVPPRSQMLSPGGWISMRKLLFALAMCFALAGLVIAAEVSVVSYDKDKKELVVKENDKEVKYTISDKVKITKTDKNGENPSDAKLEDLEKAHLSKKAIEKGVKLDITTDKDMITEIKFKGGKK